ncbi:Flagellar biosynthesis protein FlhF [Planctomycetes bacterium Pan216]|uniref:Flagellar biosynthesis protein FlhF n=1 Tax=Kolteria novifilia TaxID=2527975 RepID=A0A518B930_9BACT|nr:Flagellar biosynthesis protein FlhF [Planctomycetes bacterium Pan216]
MSGASPKTFHAETMQQALAKVRRELGPDAVILRTRQLPGQGVVGRKGGAVEITAVMETQIAPRLVPASDPRGAEPQVVSSLQERLDAMTQMLDQLQRFTPTEFPKPWFSLVSHLRRVETPDDIIRSLITFLDQEHIDPGPIDDILVREATTRFFTDRFEVAPSLEGAFHSPVVALVGPTGSGKTTSIAKLAARACVGQGRSAALVTIDSYRIAATEQLRTYAEILGIEFRSASSPKQLRTVLEELVSVDLVLIDTAGRSASDHQRAHELATYLKGGIETHLVLPANTRDSSLKAIVESFSVLSCDRVLLTKLDELPGKGALAGIAGILPCPISYMTSGQDVPDDIEPADAARLAELAMGIDAIGRPGEKGTHRPGVGAAKTVRQAIA